MKIATLMKSSTALSMVALLALSACGGGGGDGPETGGMQPGDGDAMMPGDGDGDGMMPGDGDGDGMMPGDGNGDGDGDGMMPGDGDGDGMMPGDGNGDGDGDGMMPDDYVYGLERGDAQELASTIDAVANNSGQDSQDYTSTFWHLDAIAGEYGAGVNHKRRDRTHAYASASHDESGQLHFNVAMLEDNPIQQANPWAQDGRGIGTYHDNANLEGVTRSRSPVSDPALADWHVEELANSYEGGGTLDIYVATDAQVSDGSLDSFADEIDAEFNIQLSGAPSLEDDKDFIIAWIDDGESIDGSLGGDAGTFACANEEGCAFIDNRYAGAYYAADPGITFTPDGGAACKTLSRFGAAQEHRS